MLLDELKRVYECWSGKNAPREEEETFHPPPEHRIVTPHTKKKETTTRVRSKKRQLQKEMKEEEYSPFTMAAPEEGEEEAEGVDAFEEMERLVEDALQQQEEKEETELNHMKPESEPVLPLFTPKSKKMRLSSAKESNLSVPVTDEEGRVEKGVVQSCRTCCCC
uniref:Uncharacterized protein n=1 Tax=Ditylum brightwellii TaxID=49249 RepID=A0A6U3PU44_9STRA|mmetsp:Transcript_1636/g.2645  ORF Transcript_1636/g.2645 Transcript_1636/m.2645 type:complete len:164 (+) Transcript_1636:552-1043(+)